MRRAVGLVAVVSTAAALAVLPAAPAEAVEVTVPFGTVGTHTFVVPADVTEITVDAYGAQGGDSEHVALGGLGGRATAPIVVTPGETLTVVVGGAGSITPNPSPAPAAGGFNGGGDAGGQGVGSGGGASDVRQGGASVAHRVVVAGGGGGGAFFNNVVATNGGAGGGTNGGTGVTSTAPGGGGGGGTQSGGGGGGAGTSGNAVGEAGDTDGAGEGGDGGTQPDGTSAGNFGGGGGGGGLYGGGGGGRGTAGIGGGGGGGSGFTPDGSGMTNGVRAGDGYVTLTYDVELQPDAEVALGTGPFAGSGVINATGTDQAARARLRLLHTATFTVRVRNAGGADDAFLIAAPAGNLGFRVRYFDGSADVTAAVVAGTHATGTLEPGGADVLTVRVRATLLAFFFRRIDLPVRATSTGDTAALDVVLAEARLRLL
jgi:hypothetical protein